MAKRRKTQRTQRAAPPQPEVALPETGLAGLAATSDLPPPKISPYTAHELRSYIAECARRKIEAIKLYEPLPVQLAFHECRSRVRLLRGSNRSGKTLAATVEIARAVCGIDPLNRYPKENGRWYCIGKDNRHIRETMWPKLGKAGAFKMIRDEVTGNWRSYRPWSLADAARKNDARLAPPLIPPRFIVESSWENKKEGIPSVVRLTTGWELVFYSSLGKPATGSDIDGWWFDEEIVDEEWYPEMIARILDRHGVGIWSATPQAGTDQLFELHEQADEERGLPEPNVSEFICLISDNVHMTEEDKKFFAATISEEEASVRLGGEFAISAFKVYPEFSMYVHGWEAPDNWTMPHEWARYAVVDPGYQICAVLFAAVPSPGNGDYLYIFDELYLRNCDAATFAKHMELKTRGYGYQAFLIDPKNYLSTEVGTGKTVGQQYTEQLQKHGVKSVETGSSFRMANNDISAGLLAVHGLLAMRADGAPKLRIVEGRTPNLISEFKRYHNKRVRNQVQDVPTKKNDHTMDALRYLAMANLRWVKPTAGKGPLNPVVRAFRLKQEKSRRREGMQLMHFGPGKGED